MTIPGNRPFVKGEHPTWTKTPGGRRKYNPLDDRYYGGHMSKSRNLYGLNAAEENENSMDWDEMDWNK